MRAAELALDRFYLQQERGQTICPCCGHEIAGDVDYLLVEALADYLTEKHGTECFGTVRPRIAHFQAFLEEKNKTSIFCGDVDERLITDFRDWSQKKKVVTGKGKNRKIRQRALGTTEGSVRQIIAAINLAYKHKNVKFPAKVQALKAEEVSKSPSYRSDVLELAMMFDYCLNPKRTTQKRWSPKIASKVRTQRHSLLRFLQFSVATWCRPDAAYDFSVDPSRKQWDPLAKAISLNPANRVQTKKYRPVIPAPRQIVELFRDSDGFFVPVKSVRKAFEAMQDELCLPRDRETGPKLIRRSMANLVRPMLGETQWPQGKLMMGHQKGDISDLYAPARPDYMGLAMRATEEIIDQIEALAPGAFTGASPEITTAKGAVNV